jgi:hypothetical protein
VPQVTRALLIGIDDYPEKPLRGCLNDIRAIERVLARAGVPETAITRLPTATAEEIRAALRELRSMAGFGHVLIHYSGHGTQVFTRESGKLFAREALVTAGGELLFDVELKALLGAIGAEVTLILDCCSSAGVARSPGTEIRSIEVAGPIDRAPAERFAELAAALAENERCTIAAACLADERAIEQAAGDGLIHGAWTAALLRAFAARSDAELANATWAELWEEVTAELAAKSPGQHPRLFGDRDRPIFGGDRVVKPPKPAIARERLRVDLRVDHPPLAEELARSPVLSLAARGGAADVVLAEQAGGLVVSDGRFGVEIPDYDIELARRILEHYYRYSAPLRLARNASKPLALTVDQTIELGNLSEVPLFAAIFLLRQSGVVEVLTHSEMIPARGVFRTALPPGPSGTTDRLVAIATTDRSADLSTLAVTEPFPSALRSGRDFDFDADPPALDIWASASSIVVHPDC